MTGTAHRLSRRDLARTVLRLLALGGLALGSALLLGRARRHCTRTDPCAACALQPGCNLQRGRRRPSS